MTPTLDRDGYTIIRNAVPLPAVHAAVRRLLLAVREEGLTAQEIAEGQHAGFFPHLRGEPEVQDLRISAALALYWARGMRRQRGEWADPQLHLRFPDRDQPWPLTPHVDEVPPWAQGRSYRGIVGVSLTDCGPDDGAVAVWPGSHKYHAASSFLHAITPVRVPLAAGDAIVMHPKLAHCGTLNLGHTIRMAVYFRLLAGA